MLTSILRDLNNETDLNYQHISIPGEGGVPRIRMQPTQQKLLTSDFPVHLHCLQHRTG